MLKQQRNLPTDLDSSGDDGDRPFASPPRKARGPVRSDVIDDTGWGSTNVSGLVIPVSSGPQYRRVPRLPELFLLEAVLTDAIHCIQGSHRGLSRSQFLEAYEWIASERRDWPFSFLNICDFLEIDEAAMRERLGVTANHTGDGAQASQLWLKRASTRPELDDGRDAPLDKRTFEGEHGDRFTSRSLPRALQ